MTKTLEDKLEKYWKEIEQATESYSNGYLMCLVNHDLITFSEWGQLIERKEKDQLRKDADVWNKN